VAALRVFTRQRRRVRVRIVSHYITVQQKIVGFPLHFCTFYILDQKDFSGPEESEAGPCYVEIAIILLLLVRKTFRHQFSSHSDANGDDLLICPTLAIAAIIG
jgi:hypothetical protein